MSITTSFNDEVTQLISFTVRNDSPFERTFHSEARKWHSALKAIRKQQGWSQTLWGRNFNELNEVNVFVTWEKSGDAKAFASQLDFGSAFHGVAISPVSKTCVQLKGSVSHHKPTENLIFYFPNSIPDADKSLFKEQVEGSIAGMLSSDGQDHHILSVARGWTIRDVRYKGEVAQAYVMLLTWSSMDDMYNVKKEEHSTFNNLLAPLKQIAPLGCETSFFTSLKNDGQEKVGCAVM